MYSTRWLSLRRVDPLLCRCQPGCRVLRRSYRRRDDFLRCPEPSTWAMMILVLQASASWPFVGRTSGAKRSLTYLNPTRNLRSRLRRLFFAIKSSPFWGRSRQKAERNQLFALNAQCVVRRSSKLPLSLATCIIAQTDRVDQSLQGCVALPMYREELCNLCIL